MPQDIFSEINNAVLDLQVAQLQTYQRPLRKLAQLLKHPALHSHNVELTAGLELEDFLERSRRTGGSMIGSAKLAWPEEPQKELGLTLLLIEKLGEDPDYTASFSHQFFYSGNKIMAGIHSLTGQLIIPFVRDYKIYIQSKEDFQPKVVAKGQTRGDSEPQAASITNYGIMVMNSQHVTMEKIHNLIQISQDKAIGDFLETLAKEIATVVLPSDKRSEMLDHVETLAQQASLPRQERKVGRVKACWNQLVEEAEGITKISNFLTLHGPMVAGFFETAFR